MKLTLGEIAQATGGRLLRGDPAATVRRVCTDTRLLRPGDIFVAIKGPNYDGGEFIAEAIARDASGVIAAGPIFAASAGEDAFILRVEDGAKALGDIARAWRRRVAPVVAAITGSTGKTTTKEMTAHLCGPVLPSLATEGNKNNHIGLPLTLLRLEERHRAAIVEVGMNHSGELSALASIAEPDIAVLTNIADAHIGNFPDGLKGLIAAKAELIEALPADGTALISADCPNCATARTLHRLPRRVLTFGEAPGADIRAAGVRRMRPYGYEFELHMLEWRGRVTLPLFGRYQVGNALAAAGLAFLLGVSPEEAAHGLATFQAPEMRAQVELINGVRVIEDCYNASPSATIASIRSFAEMGTDARLFLLLGGMRELGGLSEEYHRAVGRAAADPRIHEIVCCGAEARWIADEACRSHASVNHVQTTSEAAEHLRSVLRPGDSLLVKGSRLEHLERAIERLRMVPATT